MTTCAEIRERWTLRAMAARLGIELPRDGVKFRHPLRADRHPSCTVRGERLYDWSQGERGLDAIALFAMARGLDEKAAIVELARELPGAGGGKREPNAQGMEVHRPYRSEAEIRADSGGARRLRGGKDAPGEEAPSEEKARDGRTREGLTRSAAAHAAPWSRRAAAVSRQDSRVAEPNALDAPKPARPPFATLEVPTAADVAALAALRRISPDALRRAAELGHLLGAESREGRCFVVTDATRRVYQSRRLDGQPWALLQAKAWTSVAEHGLAGWPLGAAEIAERRKVLLCEGGPDWLVAHEAEPELAVCAMLGAKQRLHADALPHFTGKAVRILAHGDEAGKAAALAWAAQLTEAGARVHVAPLRYDDARDLNDLTALPIERWQHHKLHRLLCP
ncbi:hypothetical protein BH09VER1_BH09VER1_40280 [soil metagenome]